MEKRKRRGYVYHDFVVRCGVFGNISWRRPRFFLRIQSLWSSMSVYVSHLTDEVIGNQKESIVKRYIIFSSWFGESIHCERILTRGPQFFHFSFSAIKKSFPMFKSSSPMQKRSVVTFHDFVWFYRVLVSFGNILLFLHLFLSIVYRLSIQKISIDFNIFFFLFRFFSRNFHSIRVPLTQRICCCKLYKNVIQCMI